MKNKKGVALTLTLFILIIVSLLCIAFLELTTSELQIVGNHFSRLQALNIADAGVENAIAHLKFVNGWTASSASTEFPSGSGNTYIVTYPDASGKILSIGRLATGEEVTLEAGVTVRGGSSPYSIKVIDYTET